MSKATFPPLRCRPGDLCIATKPVDHRGRDLQIVGMVFKVVSLTYSRECGNPCWTYEGPRRMLGEWQLDAVADSCLTPIRGDERTTAKPRAKRRAALRLDTPPVLQPESTLRTESQCGKCGSAETQHPCGIAGR